MGERRDVASEERAHPGVGEELQEDPPGVAQHHHEGHQQPLGPTEAGLAEVGPIDLPLLARQRAQPQEGLRRLARTQQGHVMAEVVLAARVAPLPDHLEQPAGRQGGPLRQRLGRELPVRVEHRRVRRPLRTGAAGLVQRSGHRRVVHAELLGDGVHPPLLDVVEPQDHGYFL